MYPRWLAWGVDPKYSIHTNYIPWAKLIKCPEQNAYRYHRKEYKACACCFLLPQWWENKSIDRKSGEIQSYGQEAHNLAIISNSRYIKQYTYSDIVRILGRRCYHHCDTNNTAEHVCDCPPAKVRECSILVLYLVENGRYKNYQPAELVRLCVRAGKSRVGSFDATYNCNWYRG